MPDHAAARSNRLHGCGIEQGGRENGVDQVTDIIREKAEEMGDE